ncbi:hypothetical protein HMPREF9088_1950 [Enterococcus italicus DSM 15952]|uniref:Uncharacterized protein n=1 Tax=Enterococcus italicus (strain DSM 15952 / CCUG 50447 / LMG 22039 / TP 1.5) TaxID=888064 RepID=E6LHW0_ENTI1|nr:hypothetical protein HMPREF9088_1950 [Enterococcus italicus DSM 15952]
MKNIKKAVFSSPLIRGGFRFVNQENELYVMSVLVPSYTGWVPIRSLGKQQWLNIGVLVPSYTGWVPIQKCQSDLSWSSPVLVPSYTGWVPIEYLQQYDDEAFEFSSPLIRGGFRLL